MIQTEKKQAQCVILMTNKSWNTTGLKVNNENRAQRNIWREDLELGRVDKGLWKALLCYSASTKDTSDQWKAADPAQRGHITQRSPHYCSVCFPSVAMKLGPTSQLDNLSQMSWRWTDGDKRCPTCFRADLILPSLSHGHASDSVLSAASNQRRKKPLQALKIFWFTNTKLQNLLTFITF